MYVCMFMLMLMFMFMFMFMFDAVGTNRQNSVYELHVVNILLLGQKQSSPLLLTQAIACSCDSYQQS